MSDTKYSTGANLAMLIARIVIVGGLIPNGLRKLTNFEQTAAIMAGEKRMHEELVPLFNFPFPEFFLSFSLTFDLLGALLVIIGLKTRPVAAFLFGYCLLAMSIYHWDLSIPGNLHSAIRTVPMFGGLLYIAATGAGGWSLDAWLERRRNQGLMSGASTVSRA